MGEERRGEGRGRGSNARSLVQIQIQIQKLPIYWLHSLFPVRLSRGTPRFRTYGDYFGRSVTEQDSIADLLPTRPSFIMPRPFIVGKLERPSLTCSAHGYKKTERGVEIRLARVDAPSTKSEQQLNVVGWCMFRHSPFLARPPGCAARDHSPDWALRSFDFSVLALAVLC